MRYIFVHIPKTAGITSIFYLKKKHINSLCIGHDPIYINENIDTNRLKYKPVNPINNFSFSFVRNPYSRTMSAYNYLYHGGCGNALDLSYKALLNTHNIGDEPNINFLEFLKNIETYKKKIVHFVPQYEFITRNDEIIVNFVGKTENYENDMKKIFPDFVNNLLLNKSKQVVSELTDEAKKLIYIAYKKDFDLFDYSQ